MVEEKNTERIEASSTKITKKGQQQVSFDWQS